MVSPVRGDHRRFQAETPLIGLFKFPAPALWPRARIFMLEVPPRGQDLKFRNNVRLEVNSAIREMPSIKPIAIDDAIACSWKTPCENYNADGVHFTSAGYKILTKLLREALSQ
jgi:lysophospholipase L1-like esterase